MKVKQIKRCLVTGASGFIGRTLCKNLQAQDIFVRALFKHVASGPWDECFIMNLEEAKVENTVSWNDTILGNNIDTVFHLAGIAHANTISRETYWAVNVEATKKLLTLAAKMNVRRFIYLSSIKAIQPLDDYGYSKQAAENVVLTLGEQYQMHVCILRPALVYGPGVKGNLFNMLRAIERGWFPPVPYTQNQRSLTAVDDLVNAILTVALNSKANGKIYTVTDGQLYSTRQLYDAMRAALDLSPRRWSFPISYLKIAAKIGDLIQKWSGQRFFLNSEALDKLLGSAVYSSELIQSELDWRPKMNFYKALPNMVKAYKK
jgi:UDP-glucose 4-epimerase